MNNGNLIQAVRGPLMLITLGILMAIDHFGSLSFGRSWPLLVIMFGFLKVLERTVGRQEPVQPGMPQGGTQS